MNDVGEPCAGEPHARFDRGPLADQHTMDETNEQPEGQRSVPPTVLQRQRPTSPKSEAIAKPAAVSGGLSGECRQGDGSPVPPRSQGLLGRIRWIQAKRPRR